MVRITTKTTARSRVSSGHLWLRYALTISHDFPRKMNTMRSLMGFWEPWGKRQLLDKLRASVHLESVCYAVKRIQFEFSSFNSSLRARYQPITATFFACTSQGRSNKCVRCDELRHPKIMHSITCAPVGTTSVILFSFLMMSNTFLFWHYLQIHAFHYFHEI